MDERSISTLQGKCRIPFASSPQKQSLTAVDLVLRPRIVNGPFCKGFRAQKIEETRALTDTPGPWQSQNLPLLRGWGTMLIAGAKSFGCSSGKRSSCSHTHTATQKHYPETTPLRKSPNASISHGWLISTQKLHNQKSASIQFIQGLTPHVCGYQRVFFFASSNLTNPQIKHDYN